MSHSAALPKTVTGLLSPYSSDGLCRFTKCGSDVSTSMSMPCMALSASAISTAVIDDAACCLADRSSFERVMSAMYSVCLSSCARSAASSAAISSCFFISSSESTAPPAEPPPAASMSRSRWTSSFSSRITFSFGSSFTIATFSILDARFA
eukprot:Amastigsp_a847374_24.p2 type:complete len:151 gc:universal Amastigsp_a847374_24:1536-1084(-)